jgi:hypothetical protein
VGAWVGLFGIVATAMVGAQDRDTTRPDLSGRWRLNEERSENAQSKLQEMQSQSAGRGAGGHMGLGGLFGGGAQQKQIDEARGLVLDTAERFVLTQDGDRIVLTDGDGRIRRLTANGRKETIDGRDVRTRWDKQRLISETSLGSVKVTETYERSTSASQLIVTTKMDMYSRGLSVRRVYDAEGLR